MKLKRYRGIYARMPNNLDPFENWYLQVHSGRFQLETRDSNESTLYTYYLPEHLAQMSVEGALINVTDEIPQVIDDTTLQLADSPLYVEVDFDQNGQRIITNLTVTSDGKEIKVADYNAAAGIVYLAEHIDHTTDIRVDYTYKTAGMNTAAITMRARTTRPPDLNRLKDIPTVLIKATTPMLKDQRKSSSIRSFTSTSGLQKPED